DEKLGHDEKRRSPDSRGRALDAGQNEMNDIVGQIVLARRNENFRSRDLVIAISLANRLRAQQSQVRAAMRLGEVHGAGPAALDQLRKVGRLLLGRAMVHKGRNGALSETGI